MLSLSLAQAFGDGASISNGMLQIPISNLPRLTTNNPTGTQALVAIIIKVLENYQGEIDITDEFGNPIIYDNSKFYASSEAFYWHPKYQIKRNNQVFNRQQIIVYEYASN